MPWYQEIFWEAAWGIHDYELTHNLQWKIFPHLPHFLPDATGWDLDGAIVVGFDTPDQVKLLRQAKISHVVNLSPDSKIEKIPQVDGDPYAAGVLAAEYFTSLGFRQGAYLSCSVPAMQERVRGFREKMEELGGSTHPLIVFDHVSDISTPEKIKEMSRAIKQLEKPTAIYCVSDSYGRKLIQLCRDEGVHIPDEVAVLTTGNAKIICECVSPSLSSIDVGYREIGRQAAKTLHQLMEGKKVPMRTLLPPIGVIRRQSTDMLAIEDVRLRKAIIFLRAHFTEKVDVNQLAQSVGLSRRGLEYLFRGKLECSPHEEIIRLRFEQAKLLLRTTQMTIDEVAETAGFNTGHYLCNMFKQHIGTAPSTYRENNQV